MPRRLVYVGFLIVFEVEVLRVCESMRVGLSERMLFKSEFDQEDQRMNES